MKRFALTLLCILILACFTLPALADDASEEKKSDEAKQCQKKDCKKDDVNKDSDAKEKDAKKEDKEKPEEKCSKKEGDEKKDAKKDAKKEDKKTDAKKDEPKKEEKKKPEIKTIEVKKDEIHLAVKLKGIFEARKSAEIKLESEQWSAFKILRAVEHGQKVSRGDLLVAFDPEGIDRAITDGRRAMEIARLNLKKAEKEYATYQKLLPIHEKEMARAVKEMLEDQKWEDEHDRKWVKGDLESSFKYSKFRVESARSEYEQLKKMYEEDELTEQTEEMILKRTKMELEQSERYFKRAKARYEFAKKYGLERFARTYEEAKLQQKLSTETMVALFPLSVELKKISMEKQRIDFKRAQEKFKELQADRKLMTVKAPCDGVVYYGFCRNGKWSGATAGTLEKGKAVPAKKPFMTIVDTGVLQVRSSVSEKDLPLVREGLKATARAIAMPEKQLQLLFDEVATIPSSGSFNVLLKIVGKTPERIVPGMSCEIKAIGFHKKEALVVPVTAIETDPLDDAKQFVYRVDKKGKSKKVRVKTGKTVDKKVDILSGLKAGNKILPTPPKDAEKK